MNADFSVENYGSILLLRPLSTPAQHWIKKNIGRENGFQPYYPTVVVEPRYIGDILEGIHNDGLAVR